MWEVTNVITTHLGIGRFDGACFIDVCQSGCNLQAGILSAVYAEPCIKEPEHMQYI
jgi:hypothetical protein